jgi:hypothetical protein
LTPDKGHANRSSADHCMLDIQWIRRSHLTAHEFNPSIRSTIKYIAG